MKWNQWGREAVGREWGHSLQLGWCLWRRKAPQYYTPKRGGIRYAASSLNTFAKYETGSLSTVDPERPRKTTTTNKKKKLKQFMLSQVCLQENLWCSLVLTISAVVKTRNEFSLHPRWEAREGEPVSAEACHSRQNSRFAAQAHLRVHCFTATL